MELQANFWYQQRRFEDAKSEVMHALKVYEGLGVLNQVEYCRGILQDVERAME
jgi:hypothetical protein